MTVANFKGVWTSPLIISTTCDDNSFVWRQLTCTRPEVVLFFGPLSTTLGDLYQQGWFLQAEGFLKNRVATIRLVNRCRCDRYKLYVLSDPACRDFMLPIKSGAQMLGKISEKEVDPWESLLSRYPVKKPKLPTKTNMSLDELQSSFVKIITTY